MESPVSLYLDLMKITLTDFNRLEFFEYQAVDEIDVNTKILLDQQGYIACKRKIVDPETRQNGLDWPSNADTMIGVKRLDNIQECVFDILKNNVDGDFIETGVWRGGAVIFMQALLKVFNVQNKKVWVADSFEGLPKPNEALYPVDTGDIHHTVKALSISLDTVQNNFKKYHLLDDNVVFLKGWFKDTLPGAPIKKLALLRLDGDMYESTMDALTHLYPKLSVGGYCIIDDWGAVPACQRAVIDYREKNGITEGIKIIDWAGAYWKKEEK